MRKIITLLVVIATTLSMSAVTPKLGKSPKLKQSRTEVMERAAQKKAALKKGVERKQGKKSLRTLQTASPMAKVQTRAEGLVFDQSFAFLTEGTPESPVEIVTDDYYNIPASMIGEDDYGWGGEDLYQAGGCIYIPYVKDETYGYLWTPDILKPGIFTITIEACSTQAESEIDTYLAFYVEDEEAYDYADWIETPIDNEWKTYTVVWDATNYASYLPMYLEFDAWSADIMIKSIKVEAEYADLPTPEVNDYSDFTGTSFKASWQPVEGAVKYLLNVAEVDDYGYEVEPLHVENREVEGTESVVEITPGVIYSYWVQAVDAEGGKSYNSKKVEVATLLPPSNIRGNIRSDYSGFDAEWDAAPGANAYIMESTLMRKAKEAGEFVLADADFSDIESTGTLESPEEGEYLDEEYEQMPGWTFWLGATIKGAAGFVENYIYALYGYPAYIESSLYDLSGVKDGAVKIDMKAASNSGYPLWVAMVTYNEENGEYEPVSSAATENLTSEFADYSVTLNGGGKKSYIVIMSNNENVDGDAFFQSIKVTAQVEAGAEVGLPGPSDVLENGETEGSGEMSCEAGDYFKVWVTPYTLDSEGYVYIVGQASEPVAISDVAGIENAGEWQSEAPARYYNLQGMRIQNPASGSVVIRVQGDKAVKTLAK